MQFAFKIAVAMTTEWLPKIAEMWDGLDYTEMSDPAFTAITIWA